MEDDLCHKSVFLRLVFSCFPGGQVAKLFQDSSLGNAVNIVVTRLILLMEDQVGNFCLIASICIKNFLFIFCSPGIILSRMHKFPISYSNDELV